MSTRIPLLLTVVLFLSGCGSSPPSRFYGLQPIADAVERSNDQISLGIGPMSFPRYLDRPQIVTQQHSGEVVLAEFDRWAEPVSSAFQRTLAQNLDSLLVDAIVIRYPFGGGLLSVDYRLVGQVSSFVVDQSGRATLDVSWSIVDTEGNSMVSASRSIFHAQTASVTDYSQVVRAMNETLTAYSREIAQQLTAARTD